VKNGGRDRHEYDDRILLRKDSPARSHMFAPVDMAEAEKSKGLAIDEPEPRREEGAQSGPQGVQSRKRCAVRDAATADEPASHRPSGSWFYHDVKVCLVFVSHPPCLPSSLGVAVRFRFASFDQKRKRNFVSHRFNFVSHRLIPEILWTLGPEVRPECDYCAAWRRPALGQQSTFRVRIIGLKR